MKLRNLTLMLMASALLLAVGLALGGCGADKVSKASLTPLVVHVEPPKLAEECEAPNPPEPRLPEDRDSTDLDVVKHIEARRKDRRALVRLRDVCRASIKATRGAS